ncbi:hypothetical protein KP509_1Z029500 [Ceratopteris richardii]|nr:hypothetical protein KP509_1Z029500 [Ceratopteris richardii]
MGICGLNKSLFVKVLVEEVSNVFDALCMLSNVMEKGIEEDGLLHVIRKVYSDLILSPDELLKKNDQSMRGRCYEQLLQKEKWSLMLSESTLTRVGNCSNFRKMNLATAVFVSLGTSNGSGEK